LELDGACSGRFAGSPAAAGAPPPKANTETANTETDNTETDNTETDNTETDKTNAVKTKTSATAGTRARTEQTTDRRLLVRGVGLTICFPVAVATKGWLAGFQNAA